MIGLIQEGLPTKIGNLQKFDNLPMPNGEDPSGKGRCVDDVGRNLACLDVQITEVVLRRRIVRHLTNTYDTRCRALLWRRYLFLTCSPTLAVADAKEETVAAT